MKRKLICLFCTLFVLLTAFSAVAQNFLFWYPGGAGSTDEAKPILGLFCEELNKEIKGLNLNCVYINEEAAGLDFINKKKPEIAIISYPTWIKHGAKFSEGRIILSTNPVPDGKATETFSLTGTNPNDMGTIYSSEPFGEAYIKEKLFPALPGGFKNQVTDQLLLILKKISSGEVKGAAILTPLEAKTIEMLKSDWKKNLKTFSKSNPVPSARVVLLNSSWKFEKKFTNALLKLKENSQDLLKEMHLEGFSKVD